MFESLIITLREGIEASVVIGILLSYLRKINRLDLTRYVYWGLGLAILASALGAVVFQFIVINEEAYEGFIYLTAAVFVGTMLYWMWRHSKGLKGQIEGKVRQIAKDERRFSQVLGLFAFTFLMVFREGVETVLFLSAVGLTTEKLLSFIGGLVGLGLAVVFCVAFVKGTVRIDLGRFFKVSTVVLVIFILQLLVNGFHELSEAQILPASRTEMAIVGPIVRNNAFFILALLCIPILVFLLPSRRKGVLSEQPQEDLAISGPQRRLQLAQRRGQERWRRFWALSSFMVILLLGSHAVYSSRTQVLDPPLLVQAEEGFVKIPVEEVADGKLHRFGFEMKDVVVRFLVIQTAKGRFATALDLCEICGDYGYVQRGENVICLNCVAPIYLPTVGVPGGCNPIPLHSAMEGEEVVIAGADLESFSHHFTLKLLPEVQCPVCRMKMHPEEALKEVVGSQTFYLCPMESCKKEFKRRVAENLK